MSCFLTAILFILMLGCDVNAYTNSKNEQIDSSTKNIIHGLNYSVINALLENRPTELRSLMGEKLNESLGDTELEAFVDQLSEFIETEEYQIIDEYYINNSSANVTHGLTGEDYTIGYTALNKEMYTSLLELDFETTNSFIAALIYGKQDGEWKLNICQVGAYKIGQKTAIELYHKSKEQYSKGHLFDAVNNVYLSHQIVDPINGLWTYSKKEEIIEFGNRIIEELNERYNYPIEINAIASKPLLISVSPEVLADGIYPTVNYKSTIALSDTTKLKAEYHQMLKYAKKEFKGMTEENTAILFKAYEGIPDGTTEVQTYNFIYRTE